jgi:hypothetical protein
VRHEHAELRRNDIEPLRGLLADHVHRRPAAGAIGVFGLDRHIHARQMGGKRAAIGTALVGAHPGGRRVLPVVVGLAAGNGLLDVLDRQKQLLGIELLRTAAELRALQLAQQMPQAIELRQRLVAIGERGVALRPRRREQRLQRGDIHRRLRCDVAHARN